MKPRRSSLTAAEPCAETPWRPSVSDAVYPTTEAIPCHCGTKQGFQTTPPSFPHHPLDLSFHSNLKAVDKSALICIIYVQGLSQEARYELKEGLCWLYIGGIIVAVVVISAAATVITIRFDFIWECLHSCSPLAPLTPFPPFPSSTSPSLHPSRPPLLSP